MSSLGLKLSTIPQDNAKLTAYQVHANAHNCLTQPRASQSRLETLVPSRPQLRNTDQGECVITWAQAVDDATRQRTSLLHTECTQTHNCLTQPRASQSRLETLVPSRPQLRNTDQGGCVITWAQAVDDATRQRTSLLHTKCTQTHNCLTQPRASQSRLETLVPSRPQLRNTDQGECVITWAQAVDDATRQRTSLLHTKCTQTHNCLTQPRASQSRLETLVPSRPQLRNTDQGECVITWAQAVDDATRQRTSLLHTKCTQTHNCLTQPRASQSRLETLLPSRPQLRNTDQGECVITCAQAVDDATRQRTSLLHTKCTQTHNCLTQPRASQSRLETLVPSRPQLRNTDQGECVITWAQDPKIIVQTSMNAEHQTPNRH